MAIPKCRVLNLKDNNVDTTAYLIKCDNTYYGVLIRDEIPYHSKQYVRVFHKYVVFRVDGKNSRVAWKNLKDYWSKKMWKLKPMPKHIDRDDADSAIALVQYALTKKIPG